MVTGVARPVDVDGDSCGQSGRVRASGHGTAVNRASRLPLPSLLSPVAAHFSSSHPLASDFILASPYTTGHIIGRGWCAFVLPPTSLCDTLAGTVGLLWLGRVGVSWIGTAWLREGSSVVESSVLYLLSCMVGLASAAYRPCWLTFMPEWLWRNTLSADLLAVSPRTGVMAPESWRR